MDLYFLYQFQLIRYNLLKEPLWGIKPQTFPIFIGMLYQCATIIILST